jgi:hypothetical protein
MLLVEGPQLYSVLLCGVRLPQAVKQESTVVAGVLLAIGKESFNDQVIGLLSDVSEAILHQEEVHQVVFQSEYLTHIKGIRGLIRNLKANHFIYGSFNGPEYLAVT